MRSIYSTMVKDMIANMHTNPESEKKEYPSNYHWMIGEVLGRTDHWISEFSEKMNFDPESSYEETIPSIIDNCFDELYSGEKSGKLEIGFINRQLYYHCLSSYFSTLKNDIVHCPMEEYINQQNSPESDCSNSGICSG